MHIFFVSSLPSAAPIYLPLCPSRSSLCHPLPLVKRRACAQLQAYVDCVRETRRTERVGERRGEAAEGTSRRTAKYMCSSDRGHIRACGIAVELPENKPGPPKRGRERYPRSGAAHKYKTPHEVDTYTGAENRVNGRRASEQASGKSVARGEGRKGGWKGIATASITTAGESSDNLPREQSPRLLASEQQRQHTHTHTETETRHGLRRKRQIKRARRQERTAGTREAMMYGSPPPALLVVDRES